MVMYDYDVWTFFEGALRFFVAQPQSDALLLAHKNLASVTTARPTTDQPPTEGRPLPDHLVFYPDHLASYCK